jgi:osmotically-inducible protein OsmY
MWFTVPDCRENQLAGNHRSHQGMKLRIRSRAVRWIPALTIVVAVLITSSWAVEVRKIQPPSPDDSTLQRIILRKIESKRALDTDRVQVGVVDSVLTLSGLVPNIHTRNSVEDVAGTVRGLKGLKNILKVSVANRNDASLESEAYRMLRLYPRLREFDLNVTVAGATAKLSGNVPLARDRQRAEEVVGKVDGLQSIANQLNLIPAVVDPELIRRRLYKVLGNKLVFGRVADLLVKVADGGKVTLEGRVESRADLKRVVKIAFSVLGVSSVANKITFRQD